MAALLEKAQGRQADAARKERRERLCGVMRGIVLERTGKKQTKQRGRCPFRLRKIIRVCVDSN